jgi:hypothetical protein
MSSQPLSAFEASVPMLIGWVGSRVGLDTVAKENSPTFVGNLNPIAVWTENARLCLVPAWMECDASYVDTVRI